MVTKIELINKLRSVNRKTVLQAVEDLRARGWLADGTLRGIALCQADLQNVDLMGADLSSADFHQANLENVDFSKANLRAAKFKRANLHGVNFDQAELVYAELYKANLRQSINLTNEQLVHVRTLYGCVMPDGRVYDGRYNLPGDFRLAEWAKVDLQDPVQMAAFYGVSEAAYLVGQTLSLEIKV